jgi:hypothetical protein
LLQNPKSETQMVYSELLSFWTLSIVQCSKKLDGLIQTNVAKFSNEGYGSKRAVFPMMMMMMMMMMVVVVVI